MYLLLDIRGIYIFWLSFKKMLPCHFHSLNLFLLPKSFLQKISSSSIVGNRFTFSSLLTCLGRLLSIQYILFILILEFLSTTWFFYLFFIKNEKQNYTFLFILYVLGMVITLASNLFLDDYCYLSSFLTVILKTHWGDMWNVYNQMYCMTKYKIFFS